MDSSNTCEDASVTIGDMRDLFNFVTYVSALVGWNEEFSEKLAKLCTDCSKNLCAENEIPLGITLFLPPTIELQQRSRDSFLVLKKWIHEQGPYNEKNFNQWMELEAIIL